MSAHPHDAPPRGFDTALARPPAPGFPVYVGREGLRERLDTALGSALSGRGHVLVLTGEPGIGKTRTAFHLLARAREAGAATTRAYCVQDAGAPPFWPWAATLSEALESKLLSRTDLPIADRRVLAQAIPDLAHLLSEDETTPPPLPAAASRFRLFDCFRRALVQACSERPLVVLIDDLQWTDLGSLSVLHALGPRLADIPVMVIATVRDSEVEGDRADLISQIGRTITAQTESVKPLNESEVGRLATATIGSQIDLAAEKTLFGACGGNPFVLNEALKLWVDASPSHRGTEAFHLPAGMRAMLTRQLDAAGLECRRVLAAASVIGREFDLPLLCAAAQLAESAVLSRLDPALRAGLIRGVQARRHTYTFSHDLVRAALYQDLGESERAELHTFCARHLAASSTQSHRLAEAARHHYCAGPAGDCRRAVDVCRAAAAATAEHLADEDAAEHLTHALELLEHCVGRPHERSQLLIELGHALSRAGRWMEARETYLQATAEARRCDDVSSLCEAALGIATEDEVDLPDPGRVAALREAAELAPSQTALRARVLARYAYSLWFLDPALAKTVAREAVALSREIGDDTTLAFVLRLSHRVLQTGADDVQERRATSRELVRIAESMEDRLTALEYRTPCLWDALEFGNALELRAQALAIEHEAARLQLPYADWLASMFGASVAHLEGRFDVASNKAAHALEAARGLNEAFAGAAFGVQMFGILFDSGRVEELLTQFRTVADQHQALTWQLALRQLEAVTENHASSRRLLDRIVGGEFAEVPQNVNYLSNLAGLAEICIAVGDPSSAEPILERLGVFHQHHVVYAPGWIHRGSVARLRGELARLLGRAEDAAAYFEEGVERDRALGALPFVARGLAGWARVASDDEASAHREEAREINAALEISAPTSGAPRPSAPATVREEPDAGRQVLFRHEGDYWSIGNAEHPRRLRSSKGLTYLAKLLRRPRHSMLALELAAGDASLARDTSDVGSLDARAARDYRSRLEALSSQLAEAQDSGDTSRASAVQAEIGLVADELSRGLGLGGRKRPRMSPAERARVNVTKRIRTAIGKIANQDERLGRHLDNSVRTGTVISYEPDPHSNIEWVF